MFKDFAERSTLDIDRDSIENRPPPKPDILCLFMDGESVAFELKELCVPRFKEVDSYLTKSGSEKPMYIRAANPEEKTIVDALRKEYQTGHPIELLFYLDGFTARPPQALAEDIRAWSDAICHHYRRVWFMGQLDERCGCAWSCPVQWPDKNWADSQLFGPWQDSPADGRNTGPSKSPYPYIDEPALSGVNNGQRGDVPGAPAKCQSVTRFRRSPLEPSQRAPLCQHLRDTKGERD